MKLLRYFSMFTLFASVIFAMLFIGRNPSDSSDSPIPEQVVNQNTTATPTLFPPPRSTADAFADFYAYPRSPTPRLPTSTPTPRVTPTYTPTNTPPAPSFPNVPSAEQLPVIDMSRFGIQLHPLNTLDEWNVMLQHTDYLNFNWIKIQLAWDQLEPSPGQYSDLFYTYAQRVQWANFQNQPHQVMVSIAKAPDWARAEGYDPALDGPPADPTLLARFIQDFIRETKPEDNRIAAIEVWNEPNLEREWNGASRDGATYLRYFSVAYDAIKAIDPNITVLTAGLAPVGDVPAATSDRRFLRQMYEAGLANYSDVKIGIHPYGWANAPEERCCNPEQPWADATVFFFQDTILEYNNIITSYGHNTTQWITEFGWGTYQGVGVGGADVANLPQGGEFFALITAEEQAEYTLRAIDLLQQPPLSDMVEVAILWNMNFAMVGNPADTPREQAGYSLLDASGYPRLIYRYLEVARKIAPN